MITILLLLALLALLVGLGTTLKWLLIVAVILFIAGLLSGRVNTRV